MKKIALILIVLYVLSFSVSSFSFNNLDYEIRKEVEEGLVMSVTSNKVLSNLNYQNYDKKNPNVMPYIKNNRLMVPIRFIAESFMQNVTWDAAKKWIHIADRGWSKSMIFKIDNYEATIFNKDVKLDACAEITENRAFLPLRIIVESLGRNCYYQDGIIIIRYKAIDPKESWVKKIIDAAKENL